MTPTPSLFEAHRRDREDPPILIVPGLYNSGPDHWQSHWERELPNAQRVEQQDWERPLLGDWTISLAEAIRQNPGAILVAHSLGCALICHLAQMTGGRGVSGAMLVAPADVNREGPAGRLLVGFSPIPASACPSPAWSWPAATTPMSNSNAPKPSRAVGGQSSWISAARGTSMWIPGTGRG